jgi:predicted porin
MPQQNFLKGAEMKTSSVLVLVVALVAAVGFMAGAESITPLADNSMPSNTPMLGQPGSLIEVYGVIDVPIRAASNYTYTGDPIFSFTQGLFNGSRFGFRGTVGLGGSFKGIYDLEGGFVLPTGTLDQQGQIFGRQAWAGVSSDYGKLTFGRTYGTFSDAIGAGDVFGVLHGNEVYWSSSNTTATQGNIGSNDAVNGFFYQELGYRWDNSFKYEANFSGLTIGAQTMLGNVASYATSGVTDGVLNQNTMFAASLGYNSKDFPLSGAGGFQTELDSNNNHHNDIGAGIKYAFDPTDGVYVFYFHSVFDSGFARINSNNSEMSATGNATAYGRTDDIVNVAVNYYVTPVLNLIASYYFDYAQNILNGVDWGTRNSILVVADYYFTKEFDIYISASYTMFAGDLQYSPNGGDYASSVSNGGFTNVLSGMAGVRFRF